MLSVSIEKYERYWYLEHNPQLQSAGLHCHTYLDGCYDPHITQHFGTIFKYPHLFICGTCLNVTGFEFYLCCCVYVMLRSILLYWQTTKHFLLKTIRFFPSLKWLAVPTTAFMLSFSCIFKKLHKFPYGGLRNFRWTEVWCTSVTHPHPALTGLSFSFFSRLHVSRFFSSQLPALAPPSARPINTGVCFVPISCLPLPSAQTVSGPWLDNFVI